jgi:hypothetical protein
VDVETACEGLETTSKAVEGEGNIDAAYRNPIEAITTSENSEGSPMEAPRTADG